MTTALDIAKAYYQAHDAKDPAAMRAMMTDDFRFKGPAMEANSPDELLQGMAEFGCSFTNTIHHMAAAGDRVAVRFTCRFTQPASATLEMSEWLHVRDGKVCSAELFYDPAQMPTPAGS